LIVVVASRLNEASSLDDDARLIVVAAATAWKIPIDFEADELRLKVLAAEARNERLWPPTDRKSRLFVAATKIQCSATTCDWRLMLVVEAT
jgi:hypothetical protein